MSGIYVHVPFCRRKCIYCDFYSIGSSLADWSRYVDSVLLEGSEKLSRADWEAGFNTLYIGGGTPSLIPPTEFKRLASGLLELFDSPPQEFTIEVNPDDVTQEMAVMWRDSGVDRISMGVQSLDDCELRFLGRRHDSEGARKAFGVLRPIFSNISQDVMFGLPGQTSESWIHTLKGVMEMRPEHISAYSLMYEEKTALTRMRAKGRLHELPEDDTVGMFGILCEEMEMAGYEQYELSNFSLPGYRSKHNSSYWIGKPYLGLGPGAHSYDGSRLRMSNRPDLRGWLAYWEGTRENGVEKPEDSEILSGRELREEMIMTRLRTREGLNISEYKMRFGDDETRKLFNRANKAIESGTLIASGQYLSLSRMAIPISDQIIVDLF